MSFPCAPNPAPPVTFNYLAWVAQYPELGGVGQTQAQSYANQAMLMIPLDQIADPAQQTIILNAATAHFAKIFETFGGQSPSGLVGRVGNATEGSVSVGTVYTTPTSDTQAFWSQTPYGAFVWVATLRYRMGGLYVPPPCAPGFPGWPFGLR
jgi:hypothetical protein